MGSETDRLVKGQKRVLGAATGGDMSDLFAREDERRDALDAERDEAWRYKVMRAQKPVRHTRRGRGRYGRLRKPWAARPVLLQMRILRRVAFDVAPWK